MPATAAKAVQERAVAPVALENSQYMVVVRKGDAEAMRAAIDRSIARTRADKRKGDAVAFLREFRSNPRA